MRPVWHIELLLSKKDTILALFNSIYNFHQMTEIPSHLGTNHFSKYFDSLEM